MKQQEIEQRLKALNIQVTSISPMEGIFAGEVYQLSTNQGAMTLKLFAAGRRNEYQIYHVIGEYFTDIIPLVHLWPDSVLMRDCGDVIQASPDMMVRVMDTLRNIYMRPLPASVVRELPVIQEDHIERQWLKSQIAELKMADLQQLYQAVDHYYETVKAVQLPLVLTHGDCHCNNIFMTDKIQLIDWERAGMAAPVRDITMLLQDTYMDAADYKEAFYQQLYPMNMSWQKYSGAFDHYLLINTVKMMVWEIGKYQLGYQTEALMRQHLDKKLKYLKINLNIC